MSMRMSLQKKKLTEANIEGYEKIADIADIADIANIANIADIANIANIANIRKLATQTQTQTQIQNLEPSQYYKNQGIRKKASHSNFNFHLPLLNKRQKSYNANSMKLLSTCQLNKFNKQSEQYCQMSKLEKRFNKKFYLKTLNTQSNIAQRNNENNEKNKIKQKKMYKNPQYLKPSLSCNKLRTLQRIGSIASIPESRKNEYQKQKQKQIQIQVRPSQQVRKILLKSGTSENGQNSKYDENLEISHLKIRKYLNQREVKSSNTIEIPQIQQIDINKIKFFRKNKLQIKQRIKKVHRVPLKNLIKYSQDISKVKNINKISSQNSIQLQLEIKEAQQQKIVQNQNNFLSNFQNNSRQESSKSLQSLKSNVSINLLKTSASPDKNHYKYNQKYQSLKMQIKSDKIKNHFLQTHIQDRVQKPLHYVFMLAPSTKARVLVRNPFPKCGSQVSLLKLNSFEQIPLKLSQKDIKQYSQFKESKIYSNQSQISMNDRKELQELIKFM